MSATLQNLQLLTTTVANHFSTGQGDSSLHWFQTDTITTSPEQEEALNITQMMADKCRIVYKRFDYLPWNNPDNVITFQTMTLFLKVLGGVCIPILSVIGVIVNILNTTVFFQLGLRDRINFLLFVLACADLVIEAYMFLHSIEYLYTLIGGDFQLFGPLVRFILNAGVSTLYGVVYVSGFMSTMIAVERCICITRPFTATKILKTKTTAIFVLVIGLALIGISFFTSDKYRIGCAYYVHYGFTLYEYEASSFYKRNTTLVDIINGVILGVALPGFFVLTTTIATIMTAVGLKTAAAFRTGQSTVHEVDSKELALTKMLIAVSCLFIACTIPNIIVRIAPFFLPDFRPGGRFQNLLLFGICLAHLSPSVNSSLNFFFYLKMGSKFRQTLAGWTCCFKRQDLASLSEPAGN